MSRALNLVDQEDEDVCRDSPAGSLSEDAPASCVLPESPAGSTRDQTGTGAAEPAPATNGMKKPGEKSVYVKKQKAELLASMYPRWKRIMETCCLIAWGLLNVFVFYRAIVTMNLAEDYWLLALALLAGMVAADFYSGLVHWGCDTWGTIETPIFKAFIRSFREHHVDPMAITRHDYIETNGDNCMLTIPPLLLLSCVRLDFAHQAEMFVFLALASTAFWVSITNQIHKWSHTMRPPAWVAFLQASNFILSRKVHNVHHQNPYDRYYCITTGWLNPVLGVCDFWRSMEVVIERFSLNRAREDDQYWTSQVPLKDE